MTLNIQDIEWPAAMQAIMGDPRFQPVRCCRVNGCMNVFVAIEDRLWHLSISHPRRYPTWDEIKAARYTLLPDEKTFALLLPPSAQYVNIHPNCFHLHEVPQMHEEQRLVSHPTNAPLGDKYIHVKSCHECGGDVEVVCGVAITCLKCDMKLMGG